MKRSILAISILGAFMLALIYDYICKVSDVELKGLLYAAIATLGVGSYLGLRSKNESKAKEEL